MDGAAADVRLAGMDFEAGHPRADRLVRGGGMKDVVVIGAGNGGVTCAVSLARAGAGNRSGGAHISRRLRRDVLPTRNIVLTPAHPLQAVFIPVDR
jgi:NADPH-dependent glutamate synthase beta subunit-like oxidoreductase